MAPLNWLILFILFILIYLMMTCFVYFHINYLYNSQLINLNSTNSFNWKW
uniref:ATP synthase F0 subunit 8 n=1 Tax=Lepidurus apus lubbocki TaxID=217954 RepID=A0A5B7XV87_9CRUS|nr:ATP synthase F0 subunit 8 [Lepidurus apus lubbocki]QCZ36052.1 ATP synthase F0 subunit 8 [Lepidurus apus lubbocki]